MSNLMKTFQLNDSPVYEVCDEQARIDINDLKTTTNQLSSQIGDVSQFGLETEQKTYIGKPKQATIWAPGSDSQLTVDNEKYTLNPRSDGSPCAIKFSGFSASELLKMTDKVNVSFGMKTENNAQSPTPAMTLYYTFINSNGAETNKTAGYFRDGSINLLFDLKTAVETYGFDDFSFLVAGDYANHGSYITVTNFHITFEYMGKKGTSVAGVFKNIFKSNPLMNYLFVASNGSDVNGDGSVENPYATIYHANESITNNSKENPYTIIVKQGTYTDLETRYAGNTSITDYQGVVCKDYVYYESENILRPDLCIIEWDGAFGYTAPVDDNILFLKCPFHITGDSPHTHIKGFTFNVKNTRYAMHIETVGASEVCEWEVGNCVINWGAKPDSNNHTDNTPFFGMGYTYGEKGVIRNCILNYVNENSGFYKLAMTHDNTGNPSIIPRVGANITFENCAINIASSGASYAHVFGQATKTELDIPCLFRFVNCKSNVPIHFTTSDGSAENFKTIFEASEEYSN